MIKLVNQLNKFIKFNQINSFASIFKMGPTNKNFKSNNLIDQTLKLVPARLAKKMRKRSTSSSSIRHRKISLKSNSGQCPAVASCSNIFSQDKQNC